MLDYNIICAIYPDFPEIEPDTEIILYIEALTESGRYSAQMIRYGVGMLKYMLSRKDKDCMKGYEILEKAYNQFNKRNR